MNNKSYLLLASGLLFAGCTSLQSSAPLQCSSDAKSRRSPSSGGQCAAAYFESDPANPNLQGLLDFEAKSREGSFANDAEKSKAAQAALRPFFEGTSIETRRLILDVDPEIANRALIYANLSDMKPINVTFMFVEYVSRQGMLDPFITKLREREQRQSRGEPTSKFDEVAFTQKWIEQYRNLQTFQKNSSGQNGYISSENVKLLAPYLGITSAGKRAILKLAYGEELGKFILISVDWGQSNIGSAAQVVELLKQRGLTTVDQVVGNIYEYNQHALANNQPVIQPWGDWVPQP